MTAMADAPRVSILLPVFDAVETLPGCLRSIRRQTEADWECIVVDDGSTDRSLACASDFAARDPRYRVLARPHRGLVATLEDGLDHCRGRFVARMDADDWMHRERLCAQADALDADPGLTAVGSHVRLFPRNGLRDGMRAYERWINGIRTPQELREEAFVECPVAHPTLMIRHEVLAAFHYRDPGWPEDYDLILRLLGAGYRIGVVARRLVGWRDGPDRLSRTSDSYTDERFIACKASHLARTFLKDSDHYALWGYGATGRTLARHLRESGKRPAAILELHPGRIGNTIAGAPVVRPEDWLRSPDQRLVVSVAGATPRSQIRTALARAGLRQTIDYYCAA